jgi:hypothetical protein
MVTMNAHAAADGRVKPVKPGHDNCRREMGHDSWGGGGTMTIWVGMGHDDWGWGAACPRSSSRLTLMQPALVLTATVAPAIVGSFGVDQSYAVPRL